MVPFITCSVLIILLVYSDHVDFQEFSLIKVISYLSLSVTEASGTSTSIDWVRVRKRGHNSCFHSPGSEVSTLPRFLLQALGSTSGCEGSNLTINGNGFQTAFGISVTIGGTPAVHYTVIAMTQIVAVIGAGTTGRCYGNNKAWYC